MNSYLKKKLKFLENINLFKNLFVILILVFGILLRKIKNIYSDIENNNDNKFNNI